MAQTPWDMAAVGKEFSEQSALFAWAAMARSFGVEAANDRLSYTKAGHAAAFGEWRNDKLPEVKWLHAIKNQGHGDHIRGSRSKAEGVRAGVSDVFLPVSIITGSEYDFGTEGVLCGSYGAIVGWQGDILGKDSRPIINHAHHGLYMELKKLSEKTKRNGGASDIQLEFQADMRVAGYACEVVHGWEAARDCLLTYLGKAP